MMVVDVIVCSSAEIGMFIKMASYLPNGSLLGNPFTLWQGIKCLPNGSYWLAAYSWPMMSFIHWAPSKWHLHSGLLCGVEETLLTFVDFETCFCCPGPFQHYHHPALGSTDPPRRWWLACTSSFIWSQGCRSTPDDLFISIGEAGYRGSSIAPCSSAGGASTQLNMVFGSRQLDLGFSTSRSLITSW